MLPLLLKIVISIFLILLTVSTVNSQLLEKREFRLKNSGKLYITVPKVQKPNNTFALKTAQKDLFVAGVLSFIIPGAALGQFYKKEYLNGGIRLGISVVCVAWFFLSPPFSLTGDGESSSQKLIATGIYLVNWIASIIDASYEKKTPAYRKPRNYYIRF